MMRNKHFWLVVALMLSAQPAWAVTKDWNALDGDWSNGDNWLPIGAPADGDGVNIVFADDVARTVTFDATVAIEQFRLDMAGAGTNASTLSIPGGSLSTTSAYVGEAGRGTINQTAGSYGAQGQGLFLGTSDGSMGTYNLSGGSLQTDNAYVGNAGTGNFNQFGGSVTTSDGDQLYLGFLQTGVGFYTMTGGSLSAVQNEYVGYAGTGNFEHSGGTNNIAGTLDIGAQPDGIGAYALSGNGQVSASQIVVGDFGSGSFHQSGGSAVTPSLVVGANVSAEGTYTLSGGTLMAANAVIGSLAAGTDSDFGGSFSHSDGSHYVDSLFVGATGTGSYALSGGNLVTSLDAVIGHSGRGLFTQSGGSHSAGSITLGQLAGSIGGYSISGGVMNVDNVYVGGSTDGAGGTGELNISGSSTTVTVPGTIKVHNTPDTRLNLIGGTLNVGAIDVGGVPSKFNWSGGTLHVIGDVAWSGGEPANSTGAIFGTNLQLAPNRTLRVTGNETIGGNGAFTLSLTSGSTHTVTGDITLKPGGTISQTRPSTFSYTNLIQAGGTLSGSFFTNTGHYIYQSGAVNASFTNAGTVSFGATWTIQGPLTNETTLTVGSNQTLTAQSGIMNFGTFVLDGGTIGGFGPTFTNAASGTFTAHGILAGFTNHGTMIIDGVLSTSTSSQNNGVLQGTGLVGSTVGGSSQLTNNAGGVINSATPGGTLAFSNLNNNLGGMINVGPTSTLTFSSFGNNAGVINLQGASSRLAAGTANNNLNSTGTIQGAGTIAIRISNQSGIIRATGGQLDLTASDNSISSNSQLQVMADSTMMFHQGLSTLSGSLTITGGTFDNNNRPLNNQGTITGHGAIRTGGLTNQFSRLISVGSGDLDVFGTVSNQGTVNIQTGRTATFFNNVTGNGAFTGGGTAVFLGSLSPGNSPGSVSFGGNVELVGGTSLNVELGGLAPGTGYDRIQVAGELSIGGILSLSLINGFAPSAGDSFDILDWGTLHGTFSDVVLPSLGATKAWDTSNLYTSGILSVVSVALPGDHNLDGTVDAADYVMWQKVSSGTPQGYTDWVANFGAASSGSGSANQAAAQLGVPEPTSAFGILVSLVVGVSMRRRSPNIWPELAIAVATSSGNKIVDNLVFGLQRSRSAQCL